MEADRSDAAIIGGGVIGLSVARELRRAGVERVCVIEKEAALGRGSSTRANGGIRAQFTTEINITFSLYSIGEIERLRDAFDEELSFHQTGYLLFTGEPERAEGLERGAELQRSLGVETEWLSAEEVVARAPFVRGEGLLAGTYHARDGYLDPHGLVAVLERLVRRLGVEIRTGSEVASIERTGRDFELTIGEERQRATWVVNAAGAHARAVASLLHVDVPVEPVRRNLAYVHDTDAPKTPVPMCVDLDTGVLVRREGPDGFVIAYSDPNDAPGWETTVDPRFLPAVASRIGNRFPHLEGKRIHPRHCWAGLYPETPDGHAIVGEAPSVPGFIQCVGFGGHGLMHSPAAGKAVAELITNGRCESFDLRPLRPSRFEEGDLVVETAVL
ncbi:MAG: NAD(P)/FAD-dependent oxidoreductase [Actinomycetota bacterium]